MQKHLFAIISLLFFTAGCSNDFEVGAPWKEIPVTYAILDGATDVQYIRVEKAFLGEESALKIARIADSLYYPADAITVFLDLMDGNTIKKSLQATRVDGRDEGITRDTGIFAQQPNWLYKVVTAGQDSLIDGASYQVRVVRKDGKKDITGRTTIPRAVRWATPLDLTIYGSPTFPRISFDTAGKADIAWNCDSNGVYFNVDLMVRWREADINTNQTLEKFEKNFQLTRSREREKNPFTTSSVALNYRGKFETGSLLDFLNANIQPRSDRFRYFEPFRLTITGGGREIKIFNESLAANSGITSAEVVGLYSNMSEGFGIVTGRNTLQQQGLYLFNEFVKDVVQQHPKTKNLNFKL